MLSSDAITYDDLRAGLFREAELTQYVIDYRFPWAGYIYKNVYYIEGVTYDGEKWTVSIEGVGRYLTRTIGSYYTRTCRHTLGDSACDVNLTPLTQTGLAVASIVTQRSEFTILPIGGAADGDYDYGFITWQTGANAGVVSDVKSYLTGVADSIMVQIKTPYDISIGDTFDMVIGCDKLHATCKDKFSNIENFGGFPWIPGTDKTIQIVKG